MLKLSRNECVPFVCVSLLILTLIWLAVGGVDQNSEFVYVCVLLLTIYWSSGPTTLAKLIDRLSLLILNTTC